MVLIEFIGYYLLRVVGCRKPPLWGFIASGTKKPHRRGFVVSADWFISGSKLVHTRLTLSREGQCLGSEPAFWKAGYNT